MAETVDHAEKLYGKPRAKFEPQLSVASRPVEGFPMKGHLYLVYRDEDGKRWALSGRHENYHKEGIFKNWFHSNIVAEILPQEDSIDKLEKDSAKDRYSKVLSKGVKARAKWEEMAKTVAKINKAKNDYDIEGSNSNSVVSLVLSQSGFDPFKVVPQREDMLNGITGIYPGMGDLVIDENGNVTELSLAKKMLDGAAKTITQQEKKLKNSFVNQYETYHYR